MSKTKDVTPMQGACIASMTILIVAMMALCAHWIDEARSAKQEPVQIQCAVDTVIQPDGSCLPQER